MSDWCQVSSFFYVYHDENKLLVDEMMVKEAFNTIINPLD
jgi:hypothetical protein